MKKLFLLLLFTICAMLNVSAQYDDIYYGSHKKSINNNKLIDFALIGGIGVGYNTMNPTGNMSSQSISMDFILFNFMASINFGSIIDTGETSFTDTSCTQIGFLIPIFGFGEEDMFERKHKGKIYIAPIISNTTYDNWHINGHYLHKNSSYHTCSVWVDTSSADERKLTEFGGALMVKYGCGYIMAKATKTTFGISTGLVF